MSKQVFKQMKVVLDARENLIIEGPHGTGKTQVIKAMFDKEFGEGNWAYFSGSTMDPFVDFIGCPKEIKTSDGLHVLKLIKPERFARDNVKAIFIDEFNRSPKGVRNAIMELMQFKSINGEKFNNLEIIWAAINPSDGDYDVEEIDPAQLDRFHVKLKIGPEPDRTYFTKKYGKDMSNGAISWWNQLPPELKKLVSPRCLDYALTAHKAGRDLSMYLDNKTNPDKLANDIQSGSIEEELKGLTSNEELKNFFKDENNFAKTKPQLNKTEFLSKYILFFPSEKQSIAISNVFANNDLDAFFAGMYSEIMGDDTIKDEIEDFKEMLQDIVDSNNDQALASAIIESSIIDCLDNICTEV